MLACLHGGEVKTQYNPVRVSQASFKSAVLLLQSTSWRYRLATNAKNSHVVHNARG